MTKQPDEQRKQPEFWDRTRQYPAIHLALKTKLKEMTDEQFPPDLSHKMLSAKIRFNNYGNARLLICIFHTSVHSFRIPRVSNVDKLPCSMIKKLDTHWI